MSGVKEEEYEKQNERVENHYWRYIIEFGVIDGDIMV